MKYIFLLLSLISGTLFSQEYRSYLLVPDSLIQSTTVGKKMVYTYQGYSFEITGRQIKFKDKKKLIFGDEAPEGTRKVKPYVFSSGNEKDSKILLAELYSETLTGFNLYILNSLESRFIGFFGLALNAQASTASKSSPASQSLTNYLNLETNGSQWRISFNADEIVIHPGTDREEVIKGNEAKFIYTGKKLKEVKEF